jgi:hypothetical protein
MVFKSPATGIVPAIIVTLTATGFQAKTTKQQDQAREYLPHPQKIARTATVSNPIKA